jgi:outer membrane protein assembly factor BamA
MHTIVHFNNNLAANQYDIRPSPSIHLKTNSNVSNENVSQTELKILSYISEFKPSYLIIATGEYRYKLETLTFNYDKNERDSYILPNSQYTAKNDLELNFIKIGREEKFLYKKIYNGNLLSVYEFEPAMLLN